MRAGVRWSRLPGRRPEACSWADMDPCTHRRNATPTATRRGWGPVVTGVLLACSLAVQLSYGGEATPRPVAREAGGAVGELRIEGKSISRLVLRGEQEVVLDSPGEAARVPIGTYAAVAVHVDGGGPKQEYKADAGPLTVTEAGPNVLRAGAPLDNSVKLERLGTLLKLDYELTGVGGEVYKAVSLDHSKKPSFVITRGDREVHRDTLEYG